MRSPGADLRRRRSARVRRSAELGCAAAACAALAGCGNLANPKPPAATVVPPRCPERVVAHLGPEQWAAARQRLAPARASAIRLCRYAGPNARRPFALIGSRVVRGGRLVSGLVGELDTLRPLPKGVISCPEDDGSQMLALLAYPSRQVVTISAGLTGCRIVTNGSVVRTASGSQLVGQLEGLVPSSSSRSGDAGARHGRAMSAG